MTKFLGFVATLFLLMLLVLTPQQQFAHASNSTLEATSGPTDDATLEVTAEPTMESVAYDNSLTLQDNYSEETIDTPKLNIKVHKPLLVGDPSEVVKSFNTTVEQIIRDSVGSFKDETIKNQSDATLPPEIAELGSFIEVRYGIFQTTSTLVSIKFDVFWYSAGAAHPNSYSIALNYDLVANKQLQLSDLFKPKAKYLEALSAYAIKTLKAADRLSFPEGAAPKEDNYRSWNITKDGLQINFDDYQVTPHAVGPQTVVVPYATLKALIDSKGPLASIAK